MTQSEVNMLLSKILLGAVLGLIGQGIRVIIGLTKLKKESTDQAAFNESFDIKELLLSLLIGAIAGILGVLSITTAKPDSKLSDLTLQLIAIGYAGTDFIQGVLKQVLPGTGAGGGAATK